MGNWHCFGCYRVSSYNLTFSIHFNCKQQIFSACVSYTLYVCWLIIMEYQTDWKKWKKKMNHSIQGKWKTLDSKQHNYSFQKNVNWIDIISTHESIQWLVYVASAKNKTKTLWQQTLILMHKYILLNMVKVFDIYIERTKSEEKKTWI